MRYGCRRLQHARSIRQRTKRRHARRLNSYVHLFQVGAPASGAWPYRRGTLPGVLRDLRVSAYALTWMLLCGLITLYGRMLDLFGTPLE